MKVVTRYAPSPTGPQHIGGIRTALYAYLFAKKHGGEFILRIEDTDQTRYVEGAEDFIIESINWCGFEFTQGVHVDGPHGPYRQSERTELYRQHAQQLIEAGHAYYAFDTPEEIDAMKDRMREAGEQKPQYNYATREQMRNSLTMSPEEVKAEMDKGTPHVVRFKVPADETIRFEDEVRESVEIHSSHVDDKVLLKSDGHPTYHLANVVDDHMMEVTHVIRGEEWLPSTPLHILLYRAFGWEDSMPKFAHLPLLLNPDGGKMSKRNAEKYGIPILPINWEWKSDGKDYKAGDVWQGFREMGFLPEALMNFIALLGWNPGDDLEIMSMDVMIEKFSLEGVHKGGAKFDMDKLRSFNETYLRAKSKQELAKMLKENLDTNGIDTNANLEAIMEMMKERVTFIHEVHEQAPFLFEQPTTYDEKMTRKKWKPDGIKLLKSFNEAVGNHEDWSGAGLEAFAKQFVESKEVGFGLLMAPLRLSLTGAAGGPGVFDMMAFFGKEECTQRINNAIERLVPTE